MISVHFQGKLFNVTVIQVYAPITNAEEAEVAWFYDDLQDLLGAAAAKLLQSWPTLCNPIDGSAPGSPVPGISRDTGVDFHFLLQCKKVKSESEIAQSCPTLSDPMDCSLPISSVHGSLQARVLEWVAIAFPNQAPAYQKSSCCISKINKVS